ncbi:hypothetical protein CYLTODRAFT_494967, partial [Cylindrobasidium torrendii FP15055 ss-10]
MSSGAYANDIQRILGPSPSSGPSGAPFDLLTTLNAYFPDESSLAEVVSIQAKLAAEQKDLEEEIRELRAQLKTSQDSNKMQHIQELISELLGQMSRIREKATESEAVVRNITKDIQVLDLAKKNLISSLTSLKKLQMLVNALTQLEDHLRDRKYQEMAQTLSAVKEIAATFKPYLTVPRVAQIWRRIQQLQGEVRTLVESDFDKFYLEDPSHSIKASTIADACAVVDVLGDDVRASQIDRYVAMELKEYRRIFKTTDEAGQLDNISRRFAWFLRLLQNHDLHQGRVFPGEWRVGWHLLTKFTDITRDDLTTLLSKSATALTVKSLLEDLQIVSEFEGTISRKWATPISTILSATASHTGATKSLASAFEPHLSVFVDAQDKALSDMLAPHRKGAPRTSLDTPRASGDMNEEEETPLIVLPSSTELFYFYGQSLEQCAKLSSGQALFDLSKIQKKWLKVYAEEVLMPSLRRPPTISRRSGEGRFDTGSIRQASLVLNTADYCQNTAAELEQRIKEKVDESFKDRITFQDEQEVFVGCVSAAISVYVRELESACEPHFGALGKLAWTTWAQVTGPTASTEELLRAIEQVVDVIKPGIEQKKYLRNLFDKVYNLILGKFTNSLVKSRPLAEIGGEQLLIDLQALKAFLLKLPGEGLTTAGYTKGLNKATSRLESLLKVIVTPVDPAEGFILNYTLLIGDASFSNFQKILDLKGTAKHAQNDLLDAFLTVTSTKGELETTSFLSALDMDPQATTEGMLSGLASPPLSGPPTGSSGATGAGAEAKVFSDLRRFVTFGLRRDTTGP